MKKQLLSTILIISALVFCSNKSALADSQVKLVIDQSKQQFEVNGKLPTLTNIYPGYHYDGETISIKNKSETATYKLFLQIDEKVLNQIKLQGEVEVQKNGNSKKYPFSDLRKGINIKINSAEEMKVTPSFTFLGKENGNETQNVSGAISYQFLVEETVEDTKPKPPKKTIKGTLLPKTNEAKIDFTLLGIICVGIYLSFKRVRKTTEE